MRGFVGCPWQRIVWKGPGRTVRVPLRKSWESSMSSPRTRVRGLVAVSALLLGASMLSACDNGDDIQGGSADDTTGVSADSTDGSTDGSSADPSSDASQDSEDAEAG